MNLVTGGAGFIGSHLVDQLVQAGAPVRVLERPGASVDHLPLQNIELIEADIRDRLAVRRAVQGCRRIYHVAANPNLWTRNRKDFDAVNRLGTVHVLNESLEAGAERVLYTSTESILTARPSGDEPIETVELRREDIIGPYCLSKYEAELEAFRLAKTGQPVVIVSPTLPVGPGDRGMSPPTRMTVAFCRGRLPAYLDCQFNMIDARDVAAGMIAAMERGRPGRRYLLGHENVSLAEWLALVGKHIGRKPPKWKVPYSLALAIAYLSEFIADRFTGRMPNATVTGVRLTRHVMHFDPSASLAELGIRPRPIAESARDAVEWYRSMGWIQ